MKRKCVKRDKEKMCERIQRENGKRQNELKRKWKKTE